MLFQNFQTYYNQIMQKPWNKHSASFLNIGLFLNILNIFAFRSFIVSLKLGYDFQGDTEYYQNIERKYTVNITARYIISVYIYNGEWKCRERPWATNKERDKSFWILMSSECCQGEVSYSPPLWDCWVEENIQSVTWGWAARSEACQ